MFEQMRPRVRGHVGWLGVLGVVDMALMRFQRACWPAGAEISDSGSVRFNTPLRRRPEPQRLSRHKALTYSRAPNGPIGTGWSRGVSVISRCDGNKLDGAIRVRIRWRLGSALRGWPTPGAASSSGSPVAFNTEDQLGKSCTGDWIVWG